MSGILRADERRHGAGSIRTALLIVCIGSPAKAADETEAAQQPAGETVSGVVLDETGKPIAGAEICVGLYARNRIAATTDRDGRFEVAIEPGQPNHIVAAVPGMATELQTTTGGETLTFRLVRSPVLKIRIVDPEGDPIPGLVLSGDDWRDSALLVQLKTDENGRAEWTGAPTDAVEYFVMNPGYEFLVNHSLTADGREHEIVLRKAMHVIGTVVDAATGAPLDRFQVVPVGQFDSGQPFVRRDDAQDGENGRFEISLQRTDMRHGVRIESDGYRPAVSEMFEFGDDVPTLTFTLEKAPPLTGVVRDAEGTPVADATVLLATASQSVSVFFGPRDVRLEPRRRLRTSDHVWTASGPDGRFRFPPQTEPYAIVALNENGYGETHGADATAGEVILRPWSRVEGTLSQDGRPVANQNITLAALDIPQAGEPDLRTSSRTVTDEQGRFAFEHAYPKPCTVAAELSIWSDSVLASSRSVPLTPPPGETVEVTLGGDGSQLAGRVAIAGDAAAERDLSYTFAYLLAMRPGVEPPESAHAAGFDWRDGWNWNWTGTTEGVEYRNSLHHHVIKLAPDGAFAVDGVPPGDYQLAIRVFEPPVNGGCLVAPIASRIMPLHIDDAKQHIDLGTLELDPLATVRVGGQLPDFEYRDAAGELHNLSDLRGKVVLVDLWATWCITCIRNFPDVERCRAGFANEERIAFLGLNLDGDVEQAVEFAAERNLSWPQGYLGDWTESPLPTTLGIGGIPCYLVVAPDGRLLYQGSDLAAATGVLQTTVLRSRPPVEARMIPSGRRSRGP